MPMKGIAKLKIAYINTLYYPYQVGGAERSVQLLAEAMVTKGHQAHVITLTREGDRTQETHNGVVVHRLPLRNLYWPMGTVRRNALKRMAWHLADSFNVGARRDVAALLPAISPDIVHTNSLSGFSVSAWSAARRLQIPLVHSARDYYLLHPNCKLYTPKGIQRADSLTCRLWSAVKRLESRHVDAFISISDYVRRLHMDLGFFSRAASTTIYNPIRIPRQVVRKEGGPWTYGYLGRLDHSKGVDILLAAFERIDDGEHRLLIAGSGDPDYERELKARAGAGVEFLGHTKLGDFFPRVDCLVVPSRWAEPLGRVVLEAYAHGVPVIGADSGGIPEIINHGNTGLTFRSGNLAELSDCLLRIKALPRELMFAECRSMARRFSDDVIIDAYIDFYRRVAEEYAAH